jgi:peptidoglycan/xylan/chitin deacetylase (PgdA/CDA1 family)
MVALTFDACSTMRPAGYDSSITKILTATRTPASLFICGRWAEQWPLVARALAENPLFELGNHSYRHPHLRSMSASAVRRELLKAQKVIEKISGRRPELFRPPYGEYDRKIVRLAEGVGLTTVEYSLPSGDPDTNATAKRLISYVVRKARSGSIIVMHINGRGWHTAEALPSIIEGLRKRGFTLVKVSDLIAASGRKKERAEPAAPARALSPTR